MEARYGVWQSDMNGGRFRLDSKTAVIAGGGSGIGVVIATLFAKRSPDPPLEIVEKCPSQTSQAEAQVVIGIGRRSALE